MRLDRFIESTLSQSAKTVRHLLSKRLVIVNGENVVDGRSKITEFCRIEVDAEILQARQAIYIMLHKPKAYVSATRDNKNKTVLELLDVPDKNQLHLAGRLDFNSTGLLLLTNDGKWSRNITQPQQKIPKRYWVETRHEITSAYKQKFLDGIYFSFEDLTTQAAELEILTSHTAYLTIYEGRYHQIKRMFGYFDNEVLNLHRLAMGAIVLDPNLAPGDSRFLFAQEIASVVNN